MLGQLLGTYLTPRVDRGEAEASDDGALDPDWEEDARALVQVALPLLPSRVALAYAAGRSYSSSSAGAAVATAHSSPGSYSAGSTCSTVPSSPSFNGSPFNKSLLASRCLPLGRRRVAEAALLIVDVSGFTRLSEDARRRLGSEGVESFSLALSSFFAVMMELIYSHDGDVDCFAGDAVLVVFEPKVSSDEGAVAAGGGGGAAEAATPPLAEALQRALECTKAVHERLDGFRKAAGDFPLRLHSGLAAGKGGLRQ